MMQTIGKVLPKGPYCYIAEESKGRVLSTVIGYTITYRQLYPVELPLPFSPTGLYGSVALYVELKIRFLLPASTSFIT